MWSTTTAPKAGQMALRCRFAGIDNQGYYRLDGHDPSRYADYTGCGNSLNAREPAVLRMIMDSLRYWALDMGVDGFRFDLASALARSLHDVDFLSAFLAVVHQDPVISQRKLIAEPWDVGDGGYQVGNFPPLWTEWNGRYRDVVRDFWRGTGNGLAELGYRLSGSADLYQDDGRRPFASINFITAHDGFTMRDLVSYDRKHNEANGDDNRDGTDDNRSVNFGTEGETDDPAINAARDQQIRNLLSTLVLSTGVPMLVAGDEFGRTQRGNNNPYCQDNEISWVDWDLDERSRSLLSFARTLLRLRSSSTVFRQRTFFVGSHLHNGEEVADLAWFGKDGHLMTDEDWHRPDNHTIGMYFNGEQIHQRDARGERVVDDSYLMWMHAGADDTAVLLPDEKWASAYTIVLDTTDPDGPARTVKHNARLRLSGNSVLVLRAT